MATREQAPVPAGALGEFRRTAALAGLGLASCALLVAVGALVSLSWHIHPLLCPVALLAVLWVGVRLSSAVLGNRGRAGAGATARR